MSEKFNIPERCLPEINDNSHYPHLKDIEIPEVQVKAVTVLIGKDVDYDHAGAPNEDIVQNHLT